MTMRTKPGLVTTDEMDRIAEEMAEEEWSRHCEGKCVVDCTHCAHDLQADLEREGRAHDLLTQTLAWTYRALERKP